MLFKFGSSTFYHPLKYKLSYIKIIVFCNMVLLVKDILTIHALTGPSHCKIIVC